jgi:hypothetical protein
MGKNMSKFVVRSAAMKLINGWADARAVGNGIR